MDTDKILLEQFITNHPAKAARAIEKLRVEEILEFMEKMPIAINIDLIRQMNSYNGAKCLQLLKPDLAKELIENIELSLAEILLRQIEEPFRSQLLNSIDLKLANTLRKKLEFNVNTVGSLMKPSVFALGKFVLIKDALTIVKNETTNIPSVIYVVNDEDKLEGNVKIKELFFADQAKELGEIINTNIPKFVADLPIKSVRDHHIWEAHKSIPVIDRSEKLIGILDYSTIKSKTVNTNNELTAEVLATSNSLGELYRIGLVGFLQSISR